MEEEYENIREIIINNPIYTYSGTTDFKQAELVLIEIESLIREKGGSRFRRKSIHVLVELIQNATRHNASNTEIKLFVKVFKCKLFYMCENETDTANISTLTKQINKLNAMSGEELKMYLKSKLVHSPLSPKPGKMGIGLIEIARKSNNKILYKFTKINDKSSLVSLITTIDIK